jgi:drug/metabolite transporter (DMT)-like permease
MTARDVVDLVALAALWGGSFLFMRMGAGEFGPVALAAVRCGGAALLLVPLLASRGQIGALRRSWRGILLVGVTNSALPFVCFGIAALAITAGLSSIFNAATPLATALIAALWWRERLTSSRWLGMAIGLSGVAWLAWDRAGLKGGEHGVSAGWAVAACLIATSLYGFSGNYTKRRLPQVPPLAMAAGSQLSAALVLALPAWWLRPAQMPGATAWAAAIALALLCSGVAYILYFRLITHAGATNASAVTFLIPAFAVLWGWLFLDESLSVTMIVACGVVLIGTALAMGLLPRRSA